MKKAFKLSLFLIIPTIFSINLSSCGSDQSDYSTDVSKCSEKFQKLMQYIEDDNLNVFELVEINSGITYYKTFEKKRKRHNIYSISKAFTSTCIGILSDNKKLNLTDNIYDYFVDEYPSMSEEWKKVQIKHVLSQTTGIDKGYLDIDNEDKSTFGSDYLKYVLDRAPVKEPGTYFQYSDSNYYLLSSVIKKITGQNSQDFLIEKVLKPLGITDYSFAIDPKGNFMGATGLSLLATDLAKFGLLYKDYGTFNGTRIVSEEYAKEALKAQFNISSTDNYGYAFWSNTGFTYKYVTGMLNQCVFINYDDGTVISYLGDSTYDGDIVNELLDELRF